MPAAMTMTEKFTWNRSSRDILLCPSAKNGPSSPLAVSYSLRRRNVEKRVLRGKATLPAAEMPRSLRVRLFEQNHLLDRPVPTSQSAQDVHT